MPDGAIRLFNSLRQLTGPLDGWLSWRSGDSDQLNGRADRVDMLRRVFPLADAASIEALATICVPMSVPGGSALVVEGERPEALHIIVTGMFAAYRPVAHGPDQVTSRFGSGDVLGDTGFITGEAERATIRALRNCEVLRVSMVDLREAATRCSGILLAICSGVVQRLQRVEPAPPLPFRLRTFCLVPAEATIDARPILEKMAAALEAFGSVTVVSAPPTSGRPSVWFSEIERRFDFVLYQADSELTAWTKFCMRQSDRIVLLARGESEPSDCDALGVDFGHVPDNTPLSLMLLWQETILPQRTGEWLSFIRPNGHHHIRSTADIERASRLIAGRGMGLVLSGGGAKALAHIGVIEALKQHGIQIDAIGGTSIGAIIAAVCALEWELDATVRSLAGAFGRRRFSDFALSRTALYSDRAFVRTLGHCFGERAIEDAPIPLFCVSTNLTEGISTVHRTGRLVTWLRATSAVPGICPPILEQSVVYVDGGVLNNMPIDAIRAVGVGAVIAVDVGSSLEGQASFDGANLLPNIIDLLWRVGTIGSDVAAAREARDGDLVLRPHVADIGLFEWSSHERAIAAGKQVVAEHLDEISRAVKRLERGAAVS